METKSQMSSMATSLTYKSTHISRWQHRVSDEHFPEYKPGHYGVYDPLHGRNTMTPREEFKEDFVVCGRPSKHASFIVCLRGSSSPGYSSHLAREYRAGLKLALRFTTPSRRTSASMHLFERKIDDPLLAARRILGRIANEPRNLLRSHPLCAAYSCTAGKWNTAP